jgi:hypothetical protein
MIVNFYFISAIGFAVCLVLLAIYMPKYNFKQLAFALVIWTLVGVLLGASLILAFPKNKPVQTVRVTAGTSAPTITPTPTSVPTPTPQKEVKKYYSTDVVKFYKEYNSKTENTNYTEVQLEEVKREYSGKLVLWTGTVSDVKKDDNLYLVILSVGWNDENFFAYFKDAKIFDQLKELRKGQKITIEGTTGLAIWSWYLDDCKLMFK